MRPNVVCGLVWRWTGARICIWNQRDEGRSDRVGKSFQLWAARQVPLFISNSFHGREFLIQSLCAKPERIHVVYNGVEFAHSQANKLVWRNRLGVGEQCFLACMVANLHRYKDHATLLNAWASVVHRLDQVGCPAVLLLAGRFGNTYETLRELARKLELGRSVRFLGEVTDLSGLLNEVDLGVFSSQYEGCPNGVLECMAAGLAVVGTDIPGIREALGQNGYSCLVPPADAKALADKVFQFAVEPKLREKLGSVNRRRIELEFSPKRMCEETVNLITQNVDNPYP
jgi:glycosyltransferase involved in cell wall biosynthesis